MPDSNPRTRRRKASRTRSDGPGLADLLPAWRIDAAVRAEGVGWRQRVFTPAVTVWAFLAQALGPNSSCRAAVARVRAWLVGTGRPGRPTTGGFCKARARLGEAVPRRLARDAGRDLHRRAAPVWLWRGRRVKVVDGTTVSMPDTPANQREYPQPTIQQPGLGFPIARAVVVFCLATGTALDAALAGCRGKRTGEPSLLRELADALEPGDVVLADRGFGRFYELAWWQSRGVDVVVRLHQARRADFRTGRRLGREDHVAVWAKPDRLPWVDDALFAALPRRLAVREVGVRVATRGFRTRRLVVATTLADPAAYPADALADLYRLRWQAEKNQADYPRSRRWVGTRGIGYHRRDGVARTGRVVPAATRHPRRSRPMSDTRRRAAPPAPDAPATTGERPAAGVGASARRPAAATPRPARSVARPAPRGQRPQGGRS